MARGAATFKQRDLSAAIKAAVAAGCVVKAAAISPDGSIKVEFGASDNSSAKKAGKLKDWDDV